MKRGFLILASALALACSNSDDATSGAGADSSSGQGANGGSASSTESASSTGGGGSAANPFFLEPTTKTIIGVGQVIDVYPALKNASDPYPSYVDPTLVTWASSEGAASIDDKGRVIGLAGGSTTVTAQYEGHTTELVVEVAGTMVERTVMVMGQGPRKYSIYTPPGGGATPKPLLLAFHGGGGSAMLNAASTLLNALASAQGFYVVYPNGSGVIQTYNAGACCGSAQTNDVDDMAYFDVLLDDVEANFTVDSAKIYSSGFSNGGMISHRLACERADRIAGIATVAGASAQFDRILTEYYPCVPARPIPVLHIHYANDRNYPFEGGMGEGISSTDYYPVESAIADWRTRNNLTSIDDVENLTPTTQCHRYHTLANPNLPSAPVTLCVLSPPDVFDAENEIVFGGGHAWPGGVRSPSPSSDTPSQDFDADAYLWAFLNP